jgi:hypothetical protein
VSGSAELIDRPDPFGPGDLGALVMVRFRQNEGATDVVGELELLTGTTLTIRRRDDSLVEIPAASIVAAKLVGVSPLAARVLEGVAARGWPAPDTAWLGRWWLRAAGGFTARANAVRPLGPPGLALDDALRHVAGWYGERGLPARVQVVAGSSLDAELEHRGWPADPDVAVQTAPLVQALARRPDVERSVVLLADRPSPQWLALCRGGLPAEGNPIAVLTGAPDSIFAEVRIDGVAVAIGRAVVERPWVGITAVEVAAALQLYDSLDFGPHHTYRARSAPDAGSRGDC